jgi:hypothetical protein
MHYRYKMVQELLAQSNSQKAAQKQIQTHQAKYSQRKRMASDSQSILRIQLKHIICVKLC